MQGVFVDPSSKDILKKDNQDHLFCIKNGNRSVFKSHNGCYDFALVNPLVKETRAVYDTFYAKGQLSIITLAEVANSWFDSTVPWRETMLLSLGSLSGKRILILGNGKSYIEFYFLSLGAQVVFTDLSLVAIRRAQAAFRMSEFYSEFRENIEFHAADAMSLPFPDKSFDIIYGTAFVSFINNPPALYSEIARCLKPGGICRFTDDAYSPAWDKLRRLWVMLVKTPFLWKKMSPLERIRSGSNPDGFVGFKKEEIAPFIARCGFTRMVFIREYFFLRIAQLIWGRIVHWDSRYLHYARPIYLTMKWIDNRLARSKWMQRNSLGLVFGFDK